MNKDIKVEELFLQHKNKFINAVIFILALFIARNIYQQQIKEADLLKQKRDNEAKMNVVLGDIQQLENKIQGYKKTVNSKNISVAMNIMNEIAQESSLSVISIRPEMQQEKTLYTRYFFTLKLEGKNYHDFGRFISKLESRPERYCVERLELTTSHSYDMERKWLTLGITVSTILLKD